MNVFEYEFTVDAPLTAVSAFHYDTTALKKLALPFTFVQLHKVEPMGEGSVSEFTMWLGPIPVHWRAIHSNVSERGFTDTQDPEQGPAAYWQHTHTFTPLNDQQTRVHEHIKFEHKPGAAGLLTRFLFSKPNLHVLFGYRQWATQRAVKKE